MSLGYQCGITKVFSISVLNKIPNDYLYNNYKFNPYLSHFETIRTQPNLNRPVIADPGLRSSYKVCNRIFARDDDDI